MLGETMEGACLRAGNAQVQISACPCVRLSDGAQVRYNGPLSHYVQTHHNLHYSNTLTMGYFSQIVAIVQFAAKLLVFLWSSRSKMSPCQLFSVRRRTWAPVAF